VPTKAVVPQRSPAERVQIVLESANSLLVTLPFPKDTISSFAADVHGLSAHISAPPKFWEQWLILKASIIESLREHSSESQNPQVLSDFCESELTQYATRLAKVGDLLRQNNALLSSKYAKLWEYFTQVRSSVTVNMAHASPGDPESARRIRSAVIRLESFQKSVPHTYSVLFERAFSVSAKRRRSIAKMARTLSLVVDRLNAFLNPQLAVDLASRKLGALELKLRSILPQFPMNHLGIRRAKSADISLANYQQLARTRGDSGTLKSELAEIGKLQDSWRQKLADEEANWSNEQRELTSLLNRPVYAQDAKRRAAEFKELISTKSRLEREIGDHDPSGDRVDLTRHLTQQRSKLAEAKKQLVASVDRLVAVRAENAVLVSLMDADHPQYEIFQANASLFFEREQLAFRQRSLQGHKLQLEQLRARRARATCNSEVALNELRVTLRENGDLLDAIDSLRKQIERTSTDIRKKQFKNAFLRAQLAHLMKLRQLRQVGEPEHPLRGQLELATAEFERDVLVFGRRCDDDAERDFHQQFAGRLVALQEEVNAQLMETGARISALEAVMKNGQGQKAVARKFEDAERKHHGLIRWVRGAENALGIEPREMETVRGRIRCIGQRLQDVQAMGAVERIRFTKNQRRALAGAHEEEDIGDNVGARRFAGDDPDWDNGPLIPSCRCAGNAIRLRLRVRRSPGASQAVFLFRHSTARSHEMPPLLSGTYQGHEPWLRWFSTGSAELQ
jgi:hypothetical protein